MSHNFPAFSTAIVHKGFVPVTQHWCVKTKHCATRATEVVTAIGS